MSLEAEVRIKPRHCVTRLQVALDGDRILRGGELCPAQKTAEGRSACGLRLLDQELAARGEKWRGDGEEIVSDKHRRQHDEGGQTHHQRDKRAAPAADDVALHLQDLARPLAFTHRRGRHHLFRRRDDLGQGAPVRIGALRHTVRALLAGDPDKLRAGKGVDSRLTQEPDGVEFGRGSEAPPLGDALGSAQLVAGQPFGLDRGNGGVLRGRRGGRKAFVAEAVLLLLDHRGGGCRGVATDAESRGLRLHIRTSVSLLRGCRTCEGGRRAGRRRTDRTSQASSPDATR